MRGPALTHSGPDGFSPRALTHHSLRLRFGTSIYLTNNYYCTDTWTKSRGLDTAPPFAQTFNIAGSFVADDVSAWYRSPVELGWSRNIKFDHNFLGREALEPEVKHPRRVIRTLIWNPDDVIAVFASLFSDRPADTFMELPRDQRGFMWTDQVLHGDEPVGIATSRGYSYYFRQMLSLCVIDTDHAEPGTEVTVIWGNPGDPQRKIQATVAPAPYKTDNRGADLHTLA